MPHRRQGQQQGEVQHRASFRLFPDLCVLRQKLNYWRKPKKMIAIQKPDQNQWSLLILPMWRWFAYWRPRLICFAGLGCVNKQEPISCCPCCAVAVLCTQSVILQYTTHYCADPTRPDPMRRTLLLSRQHGRTLANPPDLHHFLTPQSEQKCTNFPEILPPISFPLILDIWLFSSSLGSSRKLWLMDRGGR